MSFVYRRRYTGPIEAVLLDWAGTTMDFGCMAPAVVFLQVFEAEGVPITLAEARAPMGAAKRTHIQRITRLPSVQARWAEPRGGPPTEADVDRMFEAFVPRQCDVLANYSQLTLGRPGRRSIRQSRPPCEIVRGGGCCRLEPTMSWAPLLISSPV